jgi:hypothetical protein
LIACDQLYQSEEGGGSGATGYIGNTRVLHFDEQLWVKYNDGRWVRLARAYTTTGEAWRPNFREMS